MQGGREGERERERSTQRNPKAASGFSLPFAAGIRESPVVKDFGKQDTAFKHSFPKPSPPQPFIHMQVLWGKGEIILDAREIHHGKAVWCPARTSDISFGP